MDYTHIDEKPKLRFSMHLSKRWEIHMYGLNVVSYIYTSSVERQKSLTASHLHAQLDPFASKLTICHLYVCIFLVCVDYRSIHVSRLTIYPFIIAIICIDIVMHQNKQETLKTAKAQNEHKNFT